MHQDRIPKATDLHSEGHLEQKEILDTTSRVGFCGGPELHGICTYYFKRLLSRNNIKIFSLSDRDFHEPHRKLQMFHQSYLARNVILSGPRVPVIIGWDISVNEDFRESTALEGCQQPVEKQTKLHEAGEEVRLSRQGS